MNIPSYVLVLFNITRMVNVKAKISNCFRLPGMIRVRFQWTTAFLVHGNPSCLRNTEALRSVIEYSRSPHIALLHLVLEGCCSVHGLAIICHRHREENLALTVNSGVLYTHPTKPIGRLISQCSIRRPL